MTEEPQTIQSQSAKRFVMIEFVPLEKSNFDTPRIDPSFKSINYSIIDSSSLEFIKRQSIDLSNNLELKLKEFVDLFVSDFNDSISDPKLFSFITDNSSDLRLKFISLAHNYSIQLPNYLEYPRYFDLKREFLKSTDSTNSFNSITLKSMAESLALTSNVDLESDNINLMISITKDLISKGGMKFPHDLNLDLSHFFNEKSRVLYMTNLPIDTTQSELEFWFTQFNYRPIAFWLVKFPFSQSSMLNYCSGYVIFASHEDSIDALSMNGKMQQGNLIEVQPSSSSVLDKAHEIISPFPSSKNKPRPGDWSCPSCGFSNFQRRIACFRCSFPAASAATVQGTVYVDVSSNTGPPTSTSTSTTSTIQQQQQQQYQHQQQQTTSNIYNGKSNSASTTTSRSNSSVPFRAGDWNCLNNSCSYHNFAKNITCLKCGAPRVSMAVLNGHPHHNQYDYSSRSNSLPPNQYKYQPQPQYQSSTSSNDLYANGPNSNLNTTSNAGGLDLMNGNRSMLFNASMPSTPTFQSMDYDLASRIGGLNLNSNTNGFNGFTLSKNNNGNGNGNGNNKNRNNNENNNYVSNGNDNNGFDNQL